MGDGQPPRRASDQPKKSPFLAAMDQPRRASDMLSVFYALPDPKKMPPKPAKQQNGETPSTSVAPWGTDNPQRSTNPDRPDPDGLRWPRTADRRQPDQGPSSSTTDRPDPAPLIRDQRPQDPAPPMRDQRPLDPPPTTRDLRPLDPAPPTRDQRPPDPEDIAPDPPSPTTKDQGTSPLLGKKAAPEAADGAGRKISKQSSEDSKGRRQRKVGAMPVRRSVLLPVIGADGEHAPPSREGSFRRAGPYAMNAFRRLSRARPSTFGDKMHMDSIKKIMEKFERHSTIHGICHASLAPNKRWRRFWLGVFTVCFLILVIQVIYLIIKFFQYPKTVDLDLKFENAPFPSVTVCNLNPYKASVIGKDESVKATMNAFQNILQETGRSEGVAAAIASSAVRRRRRQIQQKARETKGFERRYLQVYAQCYCEISRLSAERRPGSCFAAHKGNVSLAFGVDSQLNNFHPTKCLCQLDWVAKTLWPCFPYNSWKEHICTECVDLLGHCPMRFPPYDIVEANGRGKNNKTAKTMTTTTNNGKNMAKNSTNMAKNGHNKPRNMAKSGQNTTNTATKNGSPNMAKGDKNLKKTMNADPNLAIKNGQNGNKTTSTTPTSRRTTRTRFPRADDDANAARPPRRRVSAIVRTLDTPEDEEGEGGMDLCLCHQEYNHCVQNNINGRVPEILPYTDLHTLNFAQLFVEEWDQQQFPDGTRPMTTTTTTTPTPDIVQAMGFEELKDEIAIKSQARENLMFAVEEKPKEERIKLSQTKDELILKCSFNQHDCAIEKDFQLFYDPTYGNCYTFNWDRNAQVTAHRAGANYGLRILLYANVSEYLPTSEAVGFRITVHDKWTVPFADAFGYNAPTGFMSSFGVRMKKFFRLEPPYGHCSEGGENAETYIYKGYSYSIEGCHRSCTQNEVIRICGCADPLYPVPGNASSCKVSDPVARECIKNTSMELGDLIATGALENCKCHQPCHETAYEVTYSAARWPSGTTKLMECDSSDNMCMEKYRTNAAMVQVFYEELNYETLSESVAYSLTSLFADLGGLTGLWIGISLVSILEVFQLIWFCLDFYRNRNKQQKLSDPMRMTPDRAMQKRSLTSSSGGTSSLKRRSGIPPLITKTSVPSMGSLPSRKSTKSSLKGAVPEDIVPPVAVVIQEETDEGSTSESSSTKESAGHRSLAPDEELPCTCLYGSRGQIVFMKPLCPFHGYMVRRCSIYSSAGDEDKKDEEEEEAGEEEEKSTTTDEETKKQREEEGEDGITPEERRVLERLKSSREKGSKRHKRKDGKDKGRKE